MADITVPEAIRHYEVGMRIGAGGMGVVYAGHDRRDGSKVALKFLYPYLAAADPSFKERFEREAHTAALLRSPYTVKLLDYGIEGDLHYIVMEFVEGQTLARIIRDGPVDPARALRIARDIARALEEAEARGVVHRDIKPENVLIEDGDVVKLADFGIARQVDTGSVTRVNAYVGTPTYGAPEQGTGQADHRSDLYAVGTTLFAMITGRPPFDAPDAMAIVEQHRTAPLPERDLLRMPQPIANVIRRCMEKDPRDRYRTASDLAGAIERALETVSSRGTALVPAIGEDEVSSLMSQGSHYTPPAPPSIPSQPTPPPAGTFAETRVSAGTPAPLLVPPPGETQVAGAPRAIAAPGEARPAGAGGNRVAIIIGAAVVGLLAAGGLVFALTSGGGGGDEKADPATETPVSETATAAATAAATETITAKAVSAASQGTATATGTTPTPIPPTPVPQTALPTRANSAVPTPTPVPTEPAIPPRSIVGGQWDYLFTVESNQCAGAPFPGEQFSAAYYYDEAGQTVDGYISHGELVALTQIGGPALGTFVFSYPDFAFSYALNGGTAYLSNTFTGHGTGSGSLTETYDTTNGGTCSVFYRDG